MTALERKRAERQRRKEAGEVRVDVWLDKAMLQKMDAFAASQGLNRSQAVEALIANAPRW